MTDRRLSAMRPIPRRGLSRVEAAIYIGVGVGMFDELVRSGVMPAPRRIGSRKLWDVHQLDLAFDELPADGSETANEWDSLS
jgi:hypothetical protein